jgi:cytochrome c
MSNSRIRKAAVAAALGLAFSAAWSATPGSGLGNAATPEEIQAWNIDVRPDFQGLPPGHGSVADGTKLWEAKCASCHGDFADSNAVFPPLVGAYQANKADMKSGVVAKLADASDGFGTSIEKLSSISTLFDYIHRAMPWTAPTSLSWDETYAIVAYLLNLANIVPADFTLTRDNVQQVQNTLPNRNDMTRVHGMWPGNEFGKQPKPDTANTTCMTKCSAPMKVDSSIPEFAMTTWGNLAEQMRPWGPYGAQVTLSKADLDKAAAAKQAAGEDPNAKVIALLKANGCVGCHSMGTDTLVGPGYGAVGAKYAGKQDLVPTLVDHMLKGTSGNWGSMPMPPQSLSNDDATLVANWVVGGAKQ